MGVALDTDEAIVGEVQRKGRRGDEKRRGGLAQTERKITPRGGRDVKMTSEKPKISLRRLDAGRQWKGKQ